MTENKMKRVRFRDGLENTASSAEIKDDGTLVIEFFDFSEEAEGVFGNDVAYQLIIPAADKETILSTLINDETTMKRAGDSDVELLRLLEERFKSYFDLRDWLDENGVDYQKVFDAWA